MKEKEKDYQTSQLQSYLIPLKAMTPESQRAAESATDLSESTNQGHNRNPIVKILLSHGLKGLQTQNCALHLASPPNPNIQLFTSDTFTANTRKIQ